MEEKAEAIILKINTLGGSLAATLEIIEALKKFKGRLIAYVDKEAMSAGAYIAIITDSIYLSPKAIIGAAAIVQHTGANLEAPYNKR